MADRIARCSANVLVMGLAGNIAANLDALIRYLRTFDLNGMSGPDYLAQLRRENAPQAPAFEELIGPVASPGREQERIALIRALVESVELPKIEELFRRVRGVSGIVPGV